MGSHIIQLHDWSACSCSAMDGISDLVKRVWLCQICLWLGSQSVATTITSCSIISNAWGMSYLPTLSLHSPYVITCRARPGYLHFRTASFNIKWCNLRCCDLLWVAELVPKYDAISNATLLYYTSRLPKLLLHRGWRIKLGLMVKGSKKKSEGREKSLGY